MYKFLFHENLLLKEQINLFSLQHSFLVLKSTETSYIHLLSTPAAPKAFPFCMQSYIYKDFHSNIKKKKRKDYDNNLVVA